MAEGEETDEHCAEKDTRIDTLKTETAALKVTHRKELELEKRLSQSGEAVMWAELPKELLGMVLEKLLVSGLSGSKHVRLVSRVEGQPRCAGDTADSVFEDDRQGHVAAGAALPRGGERGGGIHRLVNPPLDRRGAASGEQPHWAHVARPQLLPQGDARGGGGASSRDRFLQPAHS
jgi:hypothetical protein